MQFRPVIGWRLRRLLGFVFVLFGLLSINSLYLAGITVIEWISGELYQEYFYQLMFLLHLLLGLVILLPAVVFGALHMRNALARPNFRAVRAGLALYTTVLLLLISGIILVRFDFFSIKDPVVRDGAYWLHVITPLLTIGLFILHRLAGKKISYKPGIAWGATAVAVVALALVPQFVEKRTSAAGKDTPPAVAADTSLFFPALASAGITCTSCHSIIKINSPRGNADYTIEAPQHYPFTFSGNGFLQWVNQQLVKAKPAFHQKTFLKPRPLWRTCN